MNPTGTYILESAEYAEHLKGARHQECPKRITVIAAALRSVQIGLTFCRAERSLSDEEICWVHSEEFLEKTNAQVEPLSKRSRAVVHWSDVDYRDTKLSSESLRVARLYGGSVLQAVDLVVGKPFASAFCNGRPPAHHAWPESTGGFCLLNHAVIAAKYLQKVCHLQQVLIVDFDVHHGDGTEASVLEEEGIWYASTHRVAAHRNDEIFYPGTGLENRHRHIINFPIPFSDDAPLLVHDAYENQLPRLLHRRKFRPQIVLITAGFDGYYRDKDGGLGLKVEDFTRITQAICRIAGGAPIVSMLAGGYEVKNGGLASCALAHVTVLNAYTLRRKV